MAMFQEKENSARKCGNRAALALSLLLVSACAEQVAGPGYGGVPALRAEVEGMRFVLRLRPDRVHVARVSPMWPPDFAEVARRAQLAVARESGCTPAWVVGDPSALEVGLSCAGKRAPAKPRARHVACDFLLSAGRDACG